MLGTELTIINQAINQSFSIFGSLPTVKGQVTQPFRVTHSGDVKGTRLNWVDFVNSYTRKAPSTPAMARCGDLRHVGKNRGFVVRYTWLIAYLYQCLSVTSGISLNLSGSQFSDL